MPTLYKLYNSVGALDQSFQLDSARDDLSCSLIAIVNLYAWSHRVRDFAMNHAAAARFEYVTIIGSTFDEVVAESRRQQLSEMHFSLLQPIDRHLIKVAQPGSDPDQIDGCRLITAVFARHVSD